MRFAKQTLCSGSKVKYALVEKNRRQCGVPALCEALQRGAGERMPSVLSTEHYRFGTFELKPDQRRLLKVGALSHCAPRAFDLQRRWSTGRLVAKDTLLGKLTCVASSYRRRSW